MSKLESLSELQLGKLYDKTNNQEYLDLIDTRIEKLHNDNVDPKTLNNEQLVLLCQRYDDDIYWTALYNKTKNSIHFCICKYANDFYKSEYVSSEDNEMTDLFSQVRLGWLKAVNTYNIVKGNAGFVAYASTIMFQHYVKLTRQVNQKHNGLSVNAINIESVHSNDDNDGDNSSAYKMIDAVCVDSGVQEAQKLEANEYIKDKLRALKAYDETMYDVVVLHYFKNVTQKQIAVIYGRNKTWVSRLLRRARTFLKGIIPEEEYIEIMRDYDK